MRKERMLSTKLYLLSFVGIVLSAVFLFYLVANASQGTVYTVDNPEAANGPSNGDSNSINYNLFSEIGDTVVGNSTSPSYSVLHGVTYEESGSVEIDIIAVPEKRVPTTGNDDSHVTVEIRAVGSTTPIFSQTVDTDVDGEYGTITAGGIAPGTYDLTAKAYSHLRRKKTSVVLGSGGNLIDFSDAGTNKLLCGDVNLVDGDNKVNSLDVTILVDQWFTNDERSDLNQDGEVNSIDITNMITNFNQLGDE